MAFMGFSTAKYLSASTEADTFPLKKIFVKISKFAGALCAGDIENNFYVSIGCRVSSKSKILRLAFL